jgi:ribosome-binding factor A
MSGRKIKVEQALRDVLAEMIARDVKDPRVSAAGMVSVTRVECNVDLSVANVYISVFAAGPARVRRGKPVAPDAPEDTVATRALAGLVGAAGFLRGPAARKINLARPPELRFHLDPSVVVGMNLREIILDDEARAAAAGRKPGDAPPDDAVGPESVPAPPRHPADDDPGDDDDHDHDPGDDDDDPGDDDDHDPDGDAADDDADAADDDEPTRDLGLASEEPTVELLPPRARDGVDEVGPDVDGDEVEP